MAENLPLADFVLWRAQDILVHCPIGGGLRRHRKSGNAFLQKNPGGTLLSNLAPASPIPNTLLIQHDH